MVKSLVKKENVNTQEETLQRSILTMAAFKGYLGLCKILLNYKAEINSKDNKGWTSLISSAQQGHVDVVKLLLGNGADVNIKNNVGASALNFSAQQGYDDVVKL